MLTDIVVENYQSLADVAVKLGQFTVITGPTSSGKSGLIGAVHLCGFNARGKDYIRHGATKCKVALGAEDEGAWAAGIERGARGSDKYILSRATGDPAEPLEAKTYTKLGGKVPEDVRAALKLSGLNFAGQFDYPYLLDTPGGQVAKTLGELTNVTVVLNAAGAAGRKKNALSAELKTVRADVERLEKEAEEFSGLPAEGEAVEQAEKALERAQQLCERTARLSDLLGALLSAVHARNEAAATLAAAAPPDLTRVDTAMAKLSRAQQLYLTLIGALEERAHFSEVLEAARRDEATASADLAATLIEAGTCPTCGQPTADVSVEVPT